MHVCGRVGFSNFFSWKDIIYRYWYYLPDFAWEIMTFAVGQVTMYHAFHSQKRITYNKRIFHVHHFMKGSISTAWYSGSCLGIWCDLSVSLSEAANNEAWLAWETQCRPQINLWRGETATGTVTHLTLCNSLYPRDTVKVMQGSLSPALSISISIMKVIMTYDRENTN